MITIPISHLIVRDPNFQTIGFFSPRGVEGRGESINGLFDPMLCALMYIYYFKKQFYHIVFNSNKGKGLLACSSNVLGSFILCNGLFLWYKISDLQLVLYISVFLSFSFRLKGRKEWRQSVKLMYLKKPSWLCWNLKRRYYDIIFLCSFVRILWSSSNCGKYEMLLVFVS